MRRSRRQWCRSRALIDTCGALRGHRSDTVGLSSFRIFCKKQSHDNGLRGQSAYLHVALIMAVPRTAFIARCLSPTTKYLLCSSIFGPRGTSRAPRTRQQPEQRYAPYSWRHGASGGAFNRHATVATRIPEDPPRDGAHGERCRLIRHLTEGPRAHTVSARSDGRVELAWRRARRMGREAARSNGIPP